MKKLIVLVSFFLFLSPLFAGEIIREFSWLTQKKQEKLLSGEAVFLKKGDISDVLRLENTENQPQTYPLLVIKDPLLTSSVYSISGKIRYRGIKGNGYLELWSSFRGKGRFFSRTLASGGPLKKLHGTSNWRPFILPFRCKPGSKLPEKLEFNLVLPGPGTVFLSSLRLTQFQPDENPLALPGGWWGNRMGGLLGAIYGVVLGLLGGIGGSLAGKGKARRSTFAIFNMITLIGVLTLLAGAAALWKSQPYAVYYPLLLGGIIATAVSLGVRKSVRRRYEELELRKMKALDAS